MVGSSIPRLDDNTSLFVLHFRGSHARPSVEPKVAREIVDLTEKGSEDTSASLPYFPLHPVTRLEHHFYKVVNIQHPVTVRSITMYYQKWSV